MDKIIKMLPYLLACALAFYGFPMLGGDRGLFVLLLLIVNPVICFVSSFIYGVNNKFAAIQMLSPVFVAILFAPTVVIYYNESALIYLAAYAGIALVGNAVGYFTARLSERIRIKRKKR